MRPGKIVLLSACLILCFVAVVQIASSYIDPVKVVTVKEEIDELIVNRPEGELVIRKNGESWTVNEKEYSGNDNACKDLVDSFSEIRILEKVTKSKLPEILAKYELDADKVRVVTVYNKGNLLKTFKVGKTSSTNSQVYMQIDGSDDIYLVAGTLQNEVSKSENEFRSKAVVNISKDDIYSITVSEEGKPSWTLTRGNEGNIWNVSGESVTEEIDIDAEKAYNWFQSSSSVACVEWLPDDAAMPGKNLLTVKYMLNDRNISLTFTQDMDSEGTEVFYGSSSETPYLFRLAKYSVQKFQKNPEDFSK